MTNYPITETLRQFIQGEKLCSLEPGILFMDEKREEQSPQLWQKMGEAGRKLVRSKFTWENNLKIHLQVYENLVS